MNNIIELIAQFVQWLIKRDAIRTVFQIILILLFYSGILQISRIANNMNKEKIVTVEKQIKTENRIIENHIEFRDGKKQHRITPIPNYDKSYGESSISMDSIWVAPVQSVGVSVTSNDSVFISNGFNRKKYTNE